MPNRMLRDWTNSEKVNALSVHAERFFTRLIMKADDYGCFYADARLLKANLFPFLLDTIREADLLRWMTECQKAGLVVLYESSGKNYLQIVEFNQRLRQKTQKFPLPTHDSSMTATCCHSADMLRHEVEVEEKVEEKEKGSVPHSLLNSNLFRKPVIPTIQQVYEAFLSIGGTKEMADKFYASNAAVEWYHKGSPITNFKNFVSGYIEAWNRNNQPKSDGWKNGLTSDQIKFRQGIG